MIPYYALGTAAHLVSKSPEKNTETRLRKSVERI